MFAVFGFVFVALLSIFLSADTNSAERAVFVAPCNPSDTTHWCVVLETRELSFVFKKENGKMVASPVPSRRVQELQVVNKADLKKWGVTLSEIVRANYNTSKKYEMQKKEKIAFHNFTRTTRVEKLTADMANGKLVVDEQVENSTRFFWVIPIGLLSFLASVILLEICRRIKRTDAVVFVDTVAAVAFVAAVIAAVVTVAVAITVATATDAIAFVATVAAVAFVVAAFVAFAIAFAAFATAVDDLKVYRISFTIYAILYSASLFLLVGPLVAGIALASSVAVFLFGWLISRKKITAE